jgi:hypothetical protein
MAYQNTLSATLKAQKRIDPNITECLQDAPSTSATTETTGSVGGVMKMNRVMFPLLSYVIQRHSVSRLSAG